MDSIFDAGIECMDPDDRWKLQSERLVSLLERLRRSASPYWQAKLQDVPAVHDIDDIALLPFTAKSELRDTYPFGMLAVPLADTVRVHASSGTKGKATVVAYTAADVEVFAEANARCIAGAGGVSSDVMHNAYGYGLFTGGLGLHYGAERLGATVVPASGGNTSLQVRMMADLGANGLLSTPSFGLLLAERAEQEGVLDDIRRTLRFGAFGAEPWSEGFRSKLEAAWGGIDACDIYGLSEVMGPGVAGECRQGKGALHVCEDHFFPEIVDPQTGLPVGPGELGELVITTLTKEALPVLRFRTGDITHFVDRPCSCGRTLRRIARLSGRTDDMLVVRGINVFPSEIEAVVLQDESVSGHYRILLDRRSTMAELVVEVELAGQGLVGARQGVAERLRRALMDRLRVRVLVEVRDPGSIERSETGKAKRVFEITA